MKDKNECMPEWDCALVYQIGDKVIWIDGTVKECSGSSWVEPQIQHREHYIEEDNDVK